MRTKVLNWISKYDMLHDGDTVVAGVSGGADSVCLLFLLCEMASTQFKDMDIEVVHINHGLRKEASLEAEFVKQLCVSFEERFRIRIGYHLIKADIGKLAAEWKQSVEEAGRRVRYEAFEEILGNRKGVICVAHHKDDRAETMLLNLFRGTGLKGAAGISAVNGRIIRPLLCVSRQEIEDLLKQESIEYIVDRTNLEDEYTRNRIRHHILSYAKDSISLSVVDNMEKAAMQFEAAEDYIHKETLKAELRSTVQKEAGRIILGSKSLQAEHPYIVDAVLYDAIAYVCGCRKDITAEHVANVRKLLTKDGSKELSLPYGAMVRKEYDRLIFMKRKTEPSIEEDIEGQISMRVLEDFDREQIPKATYTKWFDYDKISSVAVLRFRNEGDYLIINADMNQKTLKEYLINEKIPKEERGRIPLLCDGKHVMWVIGLRISEYYKVTEYTKRVLEVKFEDKAAGGSSRTGGVS